MRARVHTSGQRTPRLFHRGGTAVFARGGAVADVDVDRRAPGGTLDQLVRGRRPARAAAGSFDFLLLGGCDGLVEAFDPHGVPGPQGAETGQVRG
ncbi:hypothetical protein AT728_19025 [Streptomyces silvensis]|uniref:Uncharacterized protein n=1 Tax=Streptomyces silvensis TaxID=1765722 RepID=A0A0W7X677_9ACTN|nr:hypothetical protein AT728_19025 [Streptomyces silvensis]